MFSKKNQAKISMQKIRLNILGLSVSQTQSGAYALVLAEENGERRIPIIIGPVEAQAIAIQLEGQVDRSAAPPGGTGAISFSFSASWSSSNLLTPPTSSLSAG